MGEYCSCNMMNSFFLTISGRVDQEKCMAFCSEPIENRPKTTLKKNAVDTVREMMEVRRRFLEESIQVEEGKLVRTLSNACLQCVNFRKDGWASDGLIHYVNLSAYPSPCQCRCFYCNVYEESQSIQSAEVKGAYEKLFATLEYVKTNKLLASDARWQISCGEITIHPYKERIFDLVEGQAATFYTNCFKYDERIAKNLRENPESAINVSIDAGTPSTWHKVKGVDNFEEVAMNLTRYHLACIGQNQIGLKYIVFPGVNDRDEDYFSLMEIMKILKVTHLTISRDIRKKYQVDSEEMKELIASAGRLFAVCYRSGVTNDMFMYSKEEQRRITTYADRLLGKLRV